MAILHKKQNYSFVIYYDEECEFCRRNLGRLLIWLQVPDIQVYPAQSEPHFFALMEERNSWIVYHPLTNKIYDRFEAFLILLEQKPSWKWVSRLLSVPPFCWIGRLSYCVIARNRQWLGHFF